MCRLIAKLGALFGWLAEGLVYVPDVEPSPMKNAAVGAIVRTIDRRPPWIVVDDSIDSIVVAKWPGRVWRVEILDKASEQPLPHAHYTRAHAVRVLEEVPAPILFGAHGDAVCEVIERARRITLEDVVQIGAVVPPDAPETYSSAWKRWIEETLPGSPHRGLDHFHTLAIPSDYRTRSPIGHGFTVLYSALSDRARELVGEAAFLVDEEGDVSFTPEWAVVCEAFLHAAMAFRAPELMPVADRDLLIAAFRHVC